MIEPYHEMRLPVRISQKYTLGPSIIEPLVNKTTSPVAVAKLYVEPQECVTLCQIVNVSDKPHIIPAKTAIAIIAPAKLLSTLPQGARVTTASSTNTTSYVASVDADIVKSTKLRILREVGFQLSPDSLNVKQFDELVDSLYEYRSLFAKDVKDLPGVKDVEYDKVTTRRTPETSTTISLPTPHARGYS